MVHYMHMVMTSDETRIQMFADWPVSHVFFNKTIAQAQELEVELSLQLNKEENRVIVGRK